MTSTVTTAPLKNVLLFSQAIARVINSPDSLPRMATFHGFSGYGKTIAAIYAMNKHNATYIEVGESWGKHDLCDALLRELGDQQRGTVGTKVNKIIELLVQNGRPLIIDEFDAVAKKGYLDLIREIHDKSGTPTMLIGEEMLPKILEANERFHNRILDFVPAVPADREDLDHLISLYCPGLTLSEDLTDRLMRISQGRPRRICTNLNRIREFADMENKDHITLKAFGEGRLATGLSPARRAA